MKSSLRAYFQLTVCLALVLTGARAYSQAVPELMYYKFDSPGTSVANDASSPVGNNPATVTGLTIGGTGQFGTGLQGAAGPTASNRVNPGWTGTHTGSWTISFWMNVPTPPTTRYMFGNTSGGGTFRCFIGGAANTIRLTGGVPSITLDMPAWVAGPSVIHYVYDQVAGTVSGYINGVFQTSVTVGASYPLTGTNFVVGSQATSIDGIMDEFRMYNRALSASEVSGTWNITLPGGPCTDPPTPGIATASNVSPCSGQSIGLSVTGNSYGTGQTYQWESATSLSGPWTPEGASSSNTGLNITPPVGTTYYRCQVTCGTSSLPSTPIAVIVPTPFPGGTYTINSAVATGGSNFNSFTDAFAAIGCGITGPIVFNVAPGSGPYNEQAKIPVTIGTNSTNTLTINGNGATLTQNLTGTPSNFGTLSIDGADYITVNNLNIEALGANGFGIHLTNGANNNTFKKCNITASPTATGTTSAGVCMSGSPTVYSTGGVNGSNNSFDSCNVKGGYFGFVFYGTTTMDSNNSITNCTVKDFYVYGIYNVYQASAAISNNLIERPTRAAVSTGYGVLLTTGCINMMVEKNTIRNMYTMQPANTNTSYLLYCAVDGTAGRENKFINNLVYNIETNGTIYAMYFSGADYLQAYHNTVVLDDANSTGGDVYGIYNTGTTGGIDIRNNIIHISKGGVGTKYCVYYTGAGAKNSNYNNLYIASVGGSNNIGYNGSAQATFAAWQAATGAGSPYDVNSQNMDAIFATGASGDYSPANALLDNLGTYVNINSDIKGNARNASTPDIGAYEFAVPPCANKPDSGTAVGPVQVCAATHFMVAATGLSIGTGISYDWQSNDGSGWVSTGGTGTSYTVMGGITGATDYRVVTYCSNSNQRDTSSVWTVALKPFYFCYCSPLTGTTLHTSTANYMTNVEIVGTSLNNPTTVVGGGGYIQTNPSVPGQTAMVFENVPFSLNTTQSTTLATTEAWIDWDHSGTFDATEYYPLTLTGTTSSASITPPMGTLYGMTGMRVRVAYNSPGAYTSTAACTNITAGRETEDYVISVFPTPTCPPSSSLSTTSTAITADLNWVPTSTAIQWQLEYGVGNFAQGTGTKVTTGLMPYTTPTLPYDTSFSFMVRDICGPGDTSFWSGRKAFYLIPPNDDCANAIDLSDGLTKIGTTGGATQSMAACDGTGVANDVWYKFSTGATGGSITLDVTTTYTDVVIQALDGSCGSFTPMTPTASTTLGSNGCIDGPAAGQEYGTYTVLPNTTYYLRVYGYGAAAPGMEGTFKVFASGAPLAVKLDKISAKNIGSSNQVDWNTLSEEVSDKFELQRSADGKNFETITTRTANGRASHYTYVDNTPVSGVNYYRLLLKDVSNKTIYSEVVKAIVKTTGFTVEAYPNPVSDEMTVRVYGVKGAQGQVQITDLTGKVLKTVQLHSTEEKIDLSSLASGIYLVKYSDADHTQTVRVSKK